MLFYALVIVFVAGTAKGICLPVNRDKGNFAFAVAAYSSPLTDKGAPIGDISLSQLLEAKVSQCQELISDLRLNLKRHAKCTHQTRVWRDDNFALGEGGHSQRNSTVVADATLHENLVADFAAALDAVKVV